MSVRTLGNWVKGTKHDEAWLAARGIEMSLKEETMTVKMATATSGRRRLAVTDLAFDFSRDFSFTPVFLLLKLLG